MVETKNKHSNYKSQYIITDEMRQFSERRERRAAELGIALYILGKEPQKNLELREMEEYIVENFLDMDLDVPEDIKKKYLKLKADIHNSEGSDNK